jgi:phage antirepressor YoqD-like protein
MQLLSLNQATTMSSRDIAELVDSTHDVVLKTVRRLVAEGVVQSNETPYIHPQNGQMYTEFFLSYRDTLVIASGYSAALRAKIIDRWQELEKPKQKTRVELARENLALEEEIEAKDLLLNKQTLQLEAQAHAVAFVEKFVEAKSSKCLSDVAKILGKKPLAFINQLSSDHVIFKRNGSWIPYQTQLDAGRFTVKTGESSGHAYEQTRVEPKGIEWLAKIYG